MLRDIVVGEVGTLVKICRARERLGTLKIRLPQQETKIRGTREANVYVSPLKRERKGEGRGKRRVSRVRDRPLASWLERPKRSRNF